jgi:formylglycine-generating enzyme required for sulfatase activity
LVIVSPVDYKVYVTDDFFRDRKWFDKVAEGKLTAISKFPNQFYYAQMERYSTVPPPQPVIQSGRVSIPATRFLMGDIWPGKGVRGPGAREGDLSQIPPHEVSVSAFAIDQFPVSRAAFGRAGAAAVAEVTWQDAQDFCEQRGGRLPTEAEWELAARGPRWGDRYYGGAPSVTARRPVGNGQPPATDNPGAWTTSPWGASFHGEELAEWTVDWYSAISFRLANPQDPGGAANGAAKVVRAGPYRFAVPPDQRLEGVGFRCVYATAAPRTFVAPADSGPAPSFKPGTEPKTKKHSPIRELRLVARAEINLYAGPSVKAAVVTRVPAGTALTFVGMSDEFYLVRLDNGDEGFVRMDLVEQAPGVK